MDTPHPETDEQRGPSLGETAQIYATLNAARQFAAAAGLGEEEARLKLTQYLLDARPRGERPPYESWRFRWRHDGGKIEISAMVSREGRIAKVISVDARVPTPKRPG